MFLLLVAVVLAAGVYYAYRPRKIDIAATYIKRAEILLKTIEEAPSTDVVDECVDTISVETTGPRKKLRAKAQYSKYVVMCAKNKFGMLSRNQANLAIVRKFVLDEMTEHGVIARHISKTIDAIVETVFVHTEAELMALAIRHTDTARKRAQVAQALAGLPEAS